MKVLVFDPSGNYTENEGKGTSGWAYFEDGELKEFGDVKAKDYDRIEAYWNAVAVLILNRFLSDYVVIESYKLFAHKAQAQSWSELETPQLIGYMRMVAWSLNIPVIFQDPAKKTRFTDPILERMGILQKQGGKYYCNFQKTNLHMRDAIRHGIFFHRYTLPKMLKEGK